VFYIILQYNIIQKFVTSTMSAISWKNSAAVTDDTWQGYKKSE